jgi:hypothetical protein
LNPYHGSIPKSGRIRRSNHSGIYLGFGLK